MPGAEGDCGFPPLVFLQLLFCRKSLAELRECFPDAWAKGDGRCFAKRLVSKNIYVRVLRRLDHRAQTSDVRKNLVSIICRLGVERVASLPNLKNLRVQTILDDISFVVNRGERVGLIGPNGCGKTTLLRIIIGIEPPDAGHVLLESATMGYLPQGIDLETHQTIGEHIRAGIAD